MRRIRLSTWVLTAIFLAALVAYVLAKPSSTSHISRWQTSSQHARSTSPAGGVFPPGVIPTRSRGTPGGRG